MPDMRDGEAASSPPDRLQDLVLAAFAQAWREQRLDVADHLLRALETLCGEEDPHAHRAHAYRIVAGSRAS
jgi:hypothetical protein